jgi:RNA polymerase sigma factor (sigma-70 family)
MTELLSGVETPSDAELISRVRGGDTAAYGELFARHVEAARRLGRQLVRGADADDLVSEAFAKTLQVLQSGGGPDVAFRAYLLTSVRRLHVDRIRTQKRVQPSDDMTLYDDGLPFQDTAVASFENGAAARAFSSLPERWQLVLWHLEVEGQKPADIAPLLGMSANSVSALAYRAREGLRQAFLTMHLADCPTEECRWVNEHLGAYVRKGLSRRDTTKVDEHLEGCRRCTAMYLELDEVNSNLAAIIGPLLLGAAAAGYLSSGGAAGITGVSALFGRVRDAFGQSGGGSTATGGAATGSGAASGAGATGAAFTTGGMVAAGSVVAAGVAAVATAALVLGGSSPKEVVVEAQQPGTTAPAPADDRAALGDDAAQGGERGGFSRTGQDGSAAGLPSSGTSDAVVVATIEPTPRLAGDPTGGSPSGTDPDSGGSGDQAGGTPPGSATDSGLTLPTVDLPPPLPDVPPIKVPVPPVDVPGAPSADPPVSGGSQAVPGKGDAADGSGKGGASDPGGQKGGTSPGPGSTGEGGKTGGPGSSPADGSVGPGTNPGPGGGGGSAPGKDGPAQPSGPLSIVGSPTVTPSSAGGKGGQAGDQHRYTVTLTFAGVQDGDTLTLHLDDPQARFCDGDDCGTADSRKVTVDLAAGATKFDYRFDVRLPGKTKATLRATAGDETDTVVLQP